MKNALIAEFIGTFFLYLIIGMCVTPPGSAALTPIAACRMPSAMWLRQEFPVQRMSTFGLVML